MSDGPSDCAYAAEAQAEKFIKQRWPGAKRVCTATAAPKAGTVVLCYEEWLTHIVELVTNRQVVERWCCEPFTAPYRLKIGKEDWPVGHYDDNRLPLKDTKGGWHVPDEMKWQA